MTISAISSSTQTAPIPPIRSVEISPSSEGSLSSIGNAPTTPPPFKPSKPELTRPCLELELISSHLDLERTDAKLSNLKLAEIEHLQKKLHELHIDHVKKIQEAAKKAEQQDLWSLLKKIASYITSAISSILGATLFATPHGAVIGAIMVTAGIASIANQILLDLGAWDWIAKKLAAENEEQQKRILHVIPTTISIATGVIALSGASAAFAANAFSTVKQVAAFVAAISSFLQGTATIGKGVTDAQLTWEQGALKKLLSQQKTNQRELEETCQQFEQLVRYENSIAQTTKELIQLSNQSFKRITSQFI